MTTYEMVPATADLAEQLIPNMREADRVEAWAAGMMTSREALLSSLDISPDPQAILGDGRVLTIFGIGTWTVLALRGIPWLLTAEEMPRHARRLIPLSRAYIDDARRRYKSMGNYVDARNTKAIRWVRWLGFTVDPAKPFGPQKVPFNYFHWEAS